MEEVEAINANPRWAMPRRGWVKINVHGRFFDRPLPNGNISKIGVVVCNSRGRILRILSGSLDIQNFQMDVTLCDPEANALAAYLAGAHNFKVMVIMAQPFGRVFELWSLETEQRFVAVHEAECGRWWQ